MRMMFFKLMLVSGILFSMELFAIAPAQDDTVKVSAISEIPVIDGLGNDPCWQASRWQAIDQVWIEYGQALDSSDFSGRYQVVWSPTTNLLYVLVEIIDDVFVDGYVYNSNPSVGGGYPNYDIVEVFIDPDRSGGLHVFDGTGTTGQQWGTNAENAFSYHIAANLSPSGQTTTEKVVCDIAGKSWTNYFIPDYASHFPEFALRQHGKTNIWEFSLQVYDDSYDASNPEVARVTLNSGDIMGFSIAYCDNDDPNEVPNTRDHFIGSVWVPKEAYNDHWMNADYFGCLQLMGASTGIAERPSVPATIEIYPNPGNGIFHYQFREKGGKNSIKIFNILGQEVLALAPAPDQNPGPYRLSLAHLPDGIYILVLETSFQRMVQKITLVR